MYFKKLDIAGFKSFAEKTVLHFEPGITAIVGPNGCGKSNIFDSIRWCLGEQSIKSLRGAKMEDVIFNGTETTLAQNMAQVSLTISNEAKILPIDYDEVTISRRLFRSGESEYLINNNPVRLKDINELLMGTGIGAESYSLVEQGKIDLVISSKPEDRRLVFDEATGVSKYKAKKKEAMKRLEETDNNLLRINDIIQEVKRQIGSIERQASKARRYREVFDKLKDLELKLSSFELKTLKSEAAVLAEIAKKSHQEEADLNNRLSEFDAKSISHQKGLQELDTKISQLKDRIAELENTNERNRQHIDLNRERIVDLDKHTEILSSQKEQLKQEMARHEKSISELTIQLLSLHEVFSKREVLFKEKEDVFKTLLNDVALMQDQIKDFKTRLFDINLAGTQAHNQLNENASVLHTLLARQRRLQTEKVKTDDEYQGLSLNLHTINSEISQEKDKIKEVTGRLDALMQKKNDLDHVLKGLKENLRSRENESLSLRSQMEFLRGLKIKYDSMPEAKNGILEISDLPQEKVSGIIAHAKDVHFAADTKTYRVVCEVKFISFDLEHLESKIENTAKEIEGISSSISVKEREHEELTTASKAVEEELQKERSNLTNKEAVLLNVSDNAKKISDELALIALELSEVSEGLESAKQKETRVQDNLDSLKTETTQIEEAMAKNQNTISEKASIKESLLIEIAQLKTELANQKSKEDSLQENLNFFKNTLSQDTNATNLCDNEIEVSLLKIEELNQESVSLELGIKNNEEEVELKTKEHSNLSSIKIEEVNTLDFIQKEIIDIEEKIDKAKEDNHHYQMQEQELNFKHVNIKNRILQSYSIDIDETPYYDESMGPINIEEMGLEISTLKEKVESFGTVNLVAIEELEELKNRYDFLTQQQNDLVSAKDSLQKAILKINRTTRKMFLETFQIVAEEFKNYFKLLFGGGEAKLFLIDEEDVLESGIEIICRPPGKKLQNITLLSGGEKALSAIALIFAIFKTKPSPFCVLDEIDAALDESNIDRFRRVLSEFSKISQFIVITHNKKTISAANVMYGITMEQSGMSKIVSVKLHENEHAKASANPVKEDLSLKNTPAN